MVNVVPSVFQTNGYWSPPRNPIVWKIIKAAREDIVNDTLARSTLTLK